MKQAQTQISIRMDEATRKLLEDAARRDYRTMSEQVRYYMACGLNHMIPAPTPPFLGRVGRASKRS